MLVFWDSSTLAKRYSPEQGTEVVDRIFEVIDVGDMAVAISAFAETYSVLVRKRNARLFSLSQFAEAISSLVSQVLDDPDFPVLDVESAAYRRGLQLIRRHNINASDAAMLATYLQHSRAASQLGQQSILIVSDRKLRRAAEAEGLSTVDPEEVAVEDLDAALSGI